MGLFLAGEETEVTGVAASHSPTIYTSWGSKYNKGGSSPVLTPRRSSLAYTTSGLAGMKVVGNMVSS
jgi:hypothetical protein